MARALRDARLTPADELRDLLAGSEKLLANLRGAPSNALDLLRSMDGIAALWPALESVGADLRAEEGRWESLQSAVRGNAARITRRLGRLGGLAALRSREHPDGQAGWWWWLDRDVAARRRKGLLRLAIIGLVVVAVLMGLGLLFRTFFPVDPRVREAAGKLMEAQSKIQYEADYGAARTLFEETVALTPDDGEAWVWLGATQQKLGDGQAAADSFRRAAETGMNEVELRTRRASIYLALSMFDEALSESDAALALDPDSPEVYLIRAGVYDVRGQYPEAVAALEKAGTLADARNQPQISAAARFQLGMLLQRIPIGPAPSPTPDMP